MWGMIEIVMMSQPALMAGSKPLLTEFGIHHRWESCWYHSTETWWVREIYLLDTTRWKGSFVAWIEGGSDWTFQPPWGVWSKAKAPTDFISLKEPHRRLPPFLDQGTTRCEESQRPRRLDKSAIFARPITRRKINVWSRHEQFETLFFWWSTKHFSMR